LVIARPDNPNAIYPDPATNVPSALRVSERAVFSILQGHASRQSGEHAIISEDLRLSYAELFERVSTCATSLVHQGLIPGEVTGLSLAHEIDNLICAMALMCLGTPQVNLASHEREANKEALVGKLGVTQVIAAKPEAWMSTTRVLRPAQSAEEAMSRASGATVDVLLRDVPLDAILLYRTTSGSTNVPKTLGVSLERLLLEARRQADSPNERRVLRTSSMEFDSSRKHRICALIAGNTCVFSRQFDLEMLSALCESADVSEMHIGTYKLASLLRARAHHCQKLPSFTRVLTGGSRVPGVLRTTVREHVTNNLWVSYAMTELGVISIASPEQHEAFPEGLGFPLPGVTVTIVDSAGEFVPEGELGEARIRKAAMPHGYV
jgi:acyl-coenzyme A synthetase/AMP-(fatty) acid ligase